MIIYFFRKCIKLNFFVMQSEDGQYKFLTSLVSTSALGKVSHDHGHLKDLPLHSNN